TEVTSLAYDNVNDLAIVGAQDNGVSRQSAPGDETWNALQLADGGVVQVANIGGVTGVQYSSFQSFGNFGAHTNTGAAIDPRDLGVNGTGASKTHLTVFDKVQFANPYVVNAIDPTKFLVGSGNFNTGSGHLYLTAPDGVGNNDPMDDLALQNGAPVLNAGAFAPSATAQVGATMALAYGGRERDGGGNLVDQVEVAYAATLGNTAGSGKLYVRMAAGANFVEITGWNTGAPGGSGILDIALNPENWRRFYVIDGNSRVWRGELAADGSTNCTFTQITGNLTDLIQVGGRSTELGAIELYFDNAGTNATGDDTEVVLVGGWGGVFRAINPGATGAWSEFGVGLPNVLVTDLQYDKTDDILLAGTLGRGLFTVRGADAWLATDSVLTIRGRDGAGDAISLERNAAEPWLVDITLGNAGAPANGLPPVQQQLSAFRTIDIAGQGGNDTIVLDSGNGPIEVANRIEVRGGAGTDTLEMPGIEAISVGSADGGADLTVQGLDSFLDTRTERVHVAGVENAPDLGALPIDPVDAALGGLEAFSESLRHLIEEALRGQDIPLFDAGSLAAALNGITFDQSDPLGFAVFSQISQVEAGGLAQLDDGGSVLRRLFGFNIADWVGQVTTAAELRDKLDALDDIAGNVALNETGGVTSFDLELFSTLSGIASLEVDGPATVGARLLDGGTVELGGEVELQFDVKLDLSFGVDADGFFITTGGAPVLTVNRLRANALDLQGQGRFGFLGVELSDASLSIDPLFNYTFSLAEPAGGAADGKARLTELDDPAAAIPLSFASAGPGTADIVLEAALGVAPILPGLGALFSLPLTDATLTWADADTPSFDIGLAGAAGDALKTFTALDPEALLAQFVQFRDTLNNLVNSLPVDIPLVSQGLSGLVDLLDLVDDKLLSQLRTILPSGPSSIPSFETLQEFTSGLVSSLTDQAAGYLLDLADLGDFFSYDATANELLFTFEFGRDFVANDNLDLGFDLEEGLADLDFSTPASIDTGFEFATTIGLDLDQIFAGADPLDWFFLRDTSVSADIALAASDIDASARFGFLSIGIVDGSASGHAALSLSLNDPESNAADGRIDLGELLDGLSNLGELVDVNLTGSVEVSLPISVPFLGINPGPNTTMLLNWADVSDPASIDLQLPADLLQLPNFTNMDAGSLLSLLGQISNWLDGLRQSFDVSEVPFIGGGLDQVLGFADLFSDSLLYDDMDDEDAATGVSKLLDANNQPTFHTAQELAVKLTEILGLGDVVVYDEATESLLIELTLGDVLSSTNFGLLDLPLDFGLLDLAPLAEIQSSGNLRLSAGGGLSLTVGLYLGEAGAVELSDSTLLSSLKDGIEFSDALVIASPNEARTVYGRLSAESKFKLARNGAAPVEIVLPLASTQGNATVADLVADINAAIGATSLSGQVTASVDNKGTLDNVADDQIVLTGDAGTTALVFTAANNDPLVREGGFAASMTAADESGTRKIRATVPGLVGRPAAAAEFDISLNGANTHVSVGADKLSNNRNILDVVADVQRAVDDAGLDGKVEVASQGKTLIFRTLEAGATGFSITASGVAVNELGLPASKSGTSIDLVITTRDGAVHQIV
ncbi:MAG TPA: hypothetical protein PLL39_12960, partial [Rhodocyclaceae bacterium]|nr:hypothetical protein [Rhodocyclaceae bacterium]